MSKEPTPPNAGFAAEKTALRINLNAENLTEAPIGDSQVSKRRREEGNHSVLWMLLYPLWLALPPCRKKASVVRHLIYTAEYCGSPGPRASN